MKPGDKFEMNANDKLAITSALLFAAVLWLIYMVVMAVWCGCE
jgi:hypothetical protein